MTELTLHALLEHSASVFADHIAVVEPGVIEVDYSNLNRLADVVCGTLTKLGVEQGDRVGIHLSKSVSSLASIFGILKCGAVYVPVDSTAPAERNGYIFTDCEVRYVITRNPAGTGIDTPDTASIPLCRSDPILNDLVLLKGTDKRHVDSATDTTDLAYILYTSGSTGKPKGVMLTHQNALAFVDWCSDVFAPTTDDRFSSHAPFHFDLSILDIYVSLKHGARLILFNEIVGKQPKVLAELIASHRISFWYSTPSILRLLLDIKDVGTYDLSSLRVLLFAGEVFPIKQLRRLIELCPAPRYFNLYGPTETNVCTFYEVSPTVEGDEPVPIGRVCSGNVAAVMDEGDKVVETGVKGELYISGPSVTSGYWRLPDRNALAFHTDAKGLTWYKTGDIVVESQTGDYIYNGRRDRMIKRHGYRIELGEIEAALFSNDSITDVAVIAMRNDSDDVVIRAFIVWAGSKSPSLIQLKRFCFENLPTYMIPNQFSFHATLPKTSTDKMDYQKLKELD